MDIGAGTCVLAIALRAIGCEFPVLHIEADAHAIAVGMTLAKSINLKKTGYHTIDLNNAMATAEARAKLKKTIVTVAAGRPIIIVSRWSLHGFSSQAENERLLRFFIRDIGARGGVHDEMCGYLTPSYARMTSQMSVPIPVGNKLKDAAGDPLRYLETYPGIDVTERIEIRPHLISTRFPSSLCWVTSS